MRVTPRAIKDLASNAGLPPDLTERHLESLISFAFTIAVRARKQARSDLKEWIYDKNPDRPPLKELLRDEPKPFNLIE